MTNVNCFRLAVPVALRLDVGSDQARHGSIPFKPGVCYLAHMRLHINLNPDLVAELDKRAGKGNRSAYISKLIIRGLENERRWDDIEGALGSIDDHGHEWDEDPAAWVRSQRANEIRRAG